MAGSTLASGSVSLPEGASRAKPVSLAQDIWRRFKRHRLALVGALILLVIMLGVAIGPWLWNVPINEIDFNARLKPPSWRHPFGTDDLGQDLLSRMLYGGRISIAVGLAAMLIAVVVGTIVGAIAGMSRGLVDTALMWLTDLFLSLPQLPLLLLIIYLFRDALKRLVGSEAGVFILIVAVIGGFRWMSVARLVRAQFLSLREKEFLEAARALGASRLRQVVRHILPNAMGPVIVARNDRRRQRNHRRVDAFLPRTRVSAGYTDVGAGALRRQGLPRYRALLGAVPGHADLPHRAVDQLYRRRPAGCARPAAHPVTMTERMLEIKGLKIHFGTEEGVLHAVDGVDLGIDAGETLGVVGESGCGKSVTALAVMRLLAMPPGRIVGGEIRWRGRDLVAADDETVRALRATEIAMIFQEPMTSLNPVYTVGEQIAEVVRLHETPNRRAALERAVEMLRLVHIPNPERRVNDYPHQFSGGMRQRVMIAMALSCNPKLLIADEPTTALDVTIQAQILDLMTELKERLGMAVMLITHAMGVVAETAQRVVVMYAGKVVEEADVADLFRAPLHPYTLGLIRSIPRMDLAVAKKRRLETIAGTVPRLIDPAPGCRFAARCASVRDECLHATPPLVQVAPGHKVACVLHKV